MTIIEFRFYKSDKLGDRIGEVFLSSWLNISDFTHTPSGPPFAWGPNILNTCVTAFRDILTDCPMSPLCTYTHSKYLATGRKSLLFCRGRITDYHLTRLLCVEGPPSSSCHTRHPYPLPKLDRPRLLIPSIHAPLPHLNPTPQLLGFKHCLASRASPP